MPWQLGHSLVGLQAAEQSCGRFLIAGAQDVSHLSFARGQLHSLTPDSLLSLQMAAVNVFTASIWAGIRAVPSYKRPSDEIGDVSAI